METTPNDLINKAKLIGKKFKQYGDYTVIDLGFCIQIANSHFTTVVNKKSLIEAMRKSKTKVEDSPYNRSICDVKPFSCELQHEFYVNESFGWLYVKLRDAGKTVTLVYNQKGDCLSSIPLFQYVPNELDILAKTERYYTYREFELLLISVKTYGRYYCLYLMNSEGDYIRIGDSKYLNPDLILLRKRPIERYKDGKPVFDTFLLQADDGNHEYKNILEVSPYLEVLSVSEQYRVYKGVAISARGITKLIQ